MSNTDIVFKSNILEYYSQFSNPPVVISDVSFFTDVIDNLTTELADIGVKFFYIKWTKKICEEGPEFEYEYFGEDVLSTLPDDANYMYISERHVFFASTERDGAIYIHHGITPDLWESVNTILFKYFPNRTRGHEDTSCTIKILVTPSNSIEAQEPIARMCVKLYYPESEHYAEEELKKMIDPRICLSFSDSCEDKQSLYLEVPRNLIKELVSNMRAITNTNNTITHFEIVDFEDEVVTLDLSQYE
jgi:hypothetical protein